MTKEEVFYWALIGVRVEKARVWEDYLTAVRNGDEKNRARLDVIYKKISGEIEPAIACMEVDDD